MDSNGPVRMYRIRPLYDTQPEIMLPTCMYKMNNLLYDGSKKEPLKQDLNWIEMEKHQLNIIHKLEDLKEKVLKLKNELGIQLQQPSTKFQDIVIKANKQFPPFSLWVFYKILSQSMNVRIVSHVHSSLSYKLKKFLDMSNSEKCQVSLTIIWRQGDNDPEMMIDPVHQGIIEGEVNIARYISRMCSLSYDDDPIKSTLIDNWLEIAHSNLIHGNSKDRQGALKCLNSYLAKNKYLVGDTLTLADIVTWSAVIQANVYESLPANVSKWYESLLKNDIFSTNVLCLKT